MSVPRVSVVVPTRNGAATLPALLDALGAQRFDGGVEVIAVDSGSSDGTRALLSAQGVDVLDVPAGQFDHGATRNLAIARSRGELIVLLVQDARPVGADWLATLTRPFATRLRLAGAVARQVPRPDASAITRHYLALWAAASDRASTSHLDGGRAEFDRLTPRDRLRVCLFDNVASCLRRSVWEAHPFPATPIAEDLAWGRDVLLAGYELTYVPEAVVVHSHERSVGYELARTRLVHAQLHALFGLQTIPTRRHLARAVAGSLCRHARLEWRRPAQWPRAAALAVAWPLGQYLGARDAAVGRTWRTRPGEV